MLTKKNVLLVACGLVFGVGATLWAQQKLSTGTQRIPQFENSEVNVWKTIIMPNQPLTLHRHENPRTVIALQGGTLTIKKDTGTNAESRVGDRESLLARSGPAGRNAHGRERGEETDGSHRG